jgi:hypothetical protein
MQKPGILSTLHFQGIGAQEERIIRKLSRVWFVSFARPAEFKNSFYSIVFAKPTDHLIDRFHLSREVLVVFTPYETFDSRALDFVDKTIGDFPNRLDKLCVILISKDSEIKGKINKIAMQDKESRIVIPFSFQELEREFDVTDLVIKRLKEFFYERDLFAYDSPLKNDTYFFGRNHTIQHLYGKYKSGENGCLFGLRRIGKTSALLAVKRYMAYRDEPAVHIDCSETSFHRRRWFEALHFLISSALGSLGDTGVSGLHNESDYTDKDASKCFQEDLFIIYKAANSQRILFILDEIENITFDISPSEHWAKDKDYIFFWQALRSLFQKSETSHLFSFIIAGVNPKAVETPIVSSFDNPIYRFVSPLYLPLFETQEVEEMVSSIGTYMGLRFDDEVFTYLTDDYGGHPFLIRQVCSRIHKSVKDVRPYKVSKFFYQKERDKLSASIQDYIGLVVTVLKERYVDEYEMLELLAQGDYKTFDEFVKMSHSMIEHLEGYGLISEDNGKYHFRINAVEHYVKEHARVAKVLNTKEDKWGEISAQRNVLETNLRKLIKRTLKLHLGVAQAKIAFLETISPPETKNKLNAMSFDDMFESKILYFEDLRKIVIKNWDKFSQIFGNNKENFNLYMSYVNKHRADAHANEISDDEIGILLIALQWLRKQVDEFLD